MLSRATVLITALVSIFFIAAQCDGAIVLGFDSNTLGPNDDDSVGPVNLGFTVDFFGANRSQIFVNNNGNVTFDSPLSDFTPFDLNTTGREIIAPFFADVDTRNAGSPVTYGTGTFAGRFAFGVNWVDVDYFRSSPSHRNRNSFQLLLVDRSDVGVGDFDIIFNYDEIQWDSGEASGGDRFGLGGDSARVGFSNGTNNPGTFFELAGSAVNNAFLDGGPNALVSNSLNSPVAGRYLFQARNGTVIQVVSEPASLGQLGIGGALGMMVIFMRRRRSRSSRYLRTH